MKLINLSENKTYQKPTQYENILNSYGAIWKNNWTYLNYSHRGTQAQKASLVNFSKHLRNKWNEFYNKSFQVIGIKEQLLPNSFYEAVTPIPKLVWDETKKKNYRLISLMSIKFQTKYYN